MTTAELPHVVQSVSDDFQFERFAKADEGRVKVTEVAQLFALVVDAGWGIVLGNNIIDDKLVVVKALA